MTKCFRKGTVRSTVSMLGFSGFALFSRSDCTANSRRAGGPPPPPPPSSFHKDTPVCTPSPHRFQPGESSFQMSVDIGFFPQVVRLKVTDPSVAQSRPDSFPRLGTANDSRLVCKGMRRKERASYSGLWTPQSSNPGA